MEMVDIAATSQAIREAARALDTKPPLLVVDNTFMTPYFMV
jgi:cystathionine beta-lyase/cystathionine gamma-synthase